LKSILNLDNSLKNSESKEKSDFNSKKSIRIDSANTLTGPQLNIKKEYDDKMSKILKSEYNEKSFETSIDITNGESLVKELEEYQKNQQKRKNTDFNKISDQQTKNKIDINAEKNGIESIELLVKRVNDNTKKMEMLSKRGSNKKKKAPNFYKHQISKKGKKIKESECDFNIGDEIISSIENSEDSKSISID